MIKKENDRVIITMSKQMHEHLKEIADYENRSVSNLIVTILKHYLKNKKHITTD